MAESTRGQSGVHVYRMAILAAFLRDVDEVAAVCRCLLQLRLLCWCLL